MFCIFDTEAIFLLATERETKSVFDQEDMMLKVFSE